MKMRQQQSGYITSLLLLGACCFRFVVSFYPARVSYQSRNSIESKRDAHALTTAFEWLSLDRAWEADGTTPSFTWLDPASDNIPQTLAVDDVSGEDFLTLPLYPLGACYLPSQSTHILNNVEPRNLQMAMDLAKNPISEKGEETELWKDSRFCAVLRATDSGRIASVGTVMRIVDTEPQLDPRDGSILRIKVTCRAEELVDIVSIENPHAASEESRIRRSSEYLVARLRMRLPCRQQGEEDSHPTSSRSSSNTSMPTKAPPTNSGDSETAGRLINDYTAVRDLYLSGAGAQELPPFARDHLVEVFPEWNQTFVSEHFWQAAAVWQTLCYTIREGKQINLSADVNEVMIDAACKKGGPLKLPVHLEDLPPSVRYQVEELEVKAQEDYLKLGLDPCLDFQLMMSMSNPVKRLDFFSSLIARERQRLEEVQPSNILKDSLEQDNAADQQPRKGAWFEGFE